MSNLRISKSLARWSERSIDDLKTLGPSSIGVHHNRVWNQSRLPRELLSRGLSVAHTTTNPSAALVKAIWSQPRSKDTASLIRRYSNVPGHELANEVPIEKEDPEKQGDFGAGFWVGLLLMGSIWWFNSAPRPEPRSDPLEAEDRRRTKLWDAIEGPIAENYGEKIGDYPVSDSSFKTSETLQSTQGACTVDHCKVEDERKRRNALLYPGKRVPTTRSKCKEYGIDLHSAARRARQEGRAWCPE
ncbi:hypothetical protein LTR42_001952 [Elasticomyces elasticus]|nr:hypothetical protein LTR42_001952 [Elasticomyces elasticus]